MKKRTITKINKVEKAIIYLAWMLEDPLHDQYRLRDHVLDILGLQDVPKKKSK